MEHLQSAYSAVYHAVQAAFENGDWDKFATWGVYAFAFFYGAVYGIKKGADSVGYVMGTAWSGYKRVHRVVFPPPAPPPAPSELCLYLIDALSPANMVFDEKGRELLCGPVLVKLDPTYNYVKTIEVDKENPVSYLSEEDQKRVFNRVPEIVESYYAAKKKATVEKMMTTVHKHLHAHPAPCSPPVAINSYDAQDPGVLAIRKIMAAKHTNAADRLSKND